MTINVHYYGQIGQAIRLDDEPIDCGAPIGLTDFLRMLADRHGDEFRRQVFYEAGEVRTSLLITINDSAVSVTSDPKLQDGDEVTLLPPISGG
jgi:molybdopterin converting factor small subunit